MNHDQGYESPSLNLFPSLLFRGHARLHNQSSSEEWKQDLHFEVGLTLQ